MTQHTQDNFYLSYHSRQARTGSVALLYSGNNYCSGNSCLKNGQCNRVWAYSFSGMVFTIEPCISEGSPTIRILDDGWTVVSLDNSRCRRQQTLVLRCWQCGKVEMVNFKKVNLPKMHSQKLYFLHNLRKGPISWNVCPWQDFLA